MRRHGGEQTVVRQRHRRKRQGLEEWENGRPDAAAERLPGG